MPGWDQLSPDVQEHIKRVRAGCLALCQSYAGKMEAQAKRDRPWDDKTGNARNRLNGRAEIFTNTNDLWSAGVRLGHGVSYGIYLELGTHFFSGTKAQPSKITGLPAYAVIGPTIESNEQPFRADCEKLLKGLAGI